MIPNWRCYCASIRLNKNRVTFSYFHPVGDGNANLPAIPFLLLFQIIMQSRDLVAGDEVLENIDASPFWNRRQNLYFDSAERITRLADVMDFELQNSQ